MGCGLGCGTNVIFKAGFKVEGIDKSKTSIEVSRKRYPVSRLLPRDPGNIQKIFLLLTNHPHFKPIFAYF